MVVATMAMLAGCVGGDGAGAGFTVSDSAGIEIAVSRRGSWMDGDAWRLAQEPSVRIGVLEGAPEYQLFDARDARRMRDGRIVIADAGSGELRFFDDQGAYLLTSGGKGSGPGEFEGLGWLRPYPGDSLLAYDYSLVRVSIFDSEGEFGRSFQIQPMGEMGFVIGTDAFSDGTVLARSPLIFAGGFGDGMSRKPEVFHTYSNTGELADSIGEFPGPDQFIRTGSGSGNRFVAVTTPPFGRMPARAVHGTQFFFGSGDSYEIECHEKTGELVRLIRLDRPSRRVTEADLERFIERRLQELDEGENEQEARQRLEAMPVPETMPVYEDLVVDAAGNLWVRDYQLDGDAPSEWVVFDGSGRMLGSVTTPAGLEVTEIGEDFVLGIWRDELDVQHVQLYELMKGTTAGG
jgi:hypothetical protein